MTKQENALRYLEVVGGLDPENAYFAVDDQQRMIYWSKGAEKALGYRAEEVVGAHCSKAIHCVRCSTGCGLKSQGVIEGKEMRHFHKQFQRNRIT